MKYTAKIEDLTFHLEITEVNGELELKLDGETIPFDLARFENSHLVSLLIANRCIEAEVHQNSNGYEVWLQGERIKCQLEDEKTARLKSLVARTDDVGKENELRSPMPGLVVAIEVKVGDEVRLGQGLVIVEAMKMENEVKAPFAGKVRNIRIRPGQAVDKEEILISFE